MQTLRKRSSPCKYKNEPSRFLGEGMTFKAKLIGILEVNEARGDKMCQDALNDLKTAIKAAGEHKQRITISIAIDGLRLRDEKSGDCLYHHPVHKISFIAQDMSDSRAFGYIFGSPDTGHRFFGIKTDKTASQVVISMRDLFQVVFELKKKEIEMAKHHIEQRQMKYGGPGPGDSVHSLKDEFDAERSKGKYPQLAKIRCMTWKSTESPGASAKANPSEAIADLLDLEHELNSIQQGISQMERITPSDPFGPLSKGDPFLDAFEDSFSSRPEMHAESKATAPVQPSAGTGPQLSAGDSAPVADKQPPCGFFPTTDSGPERPQPQPQSQPPFFSHFSPVPPGKPPAEETHWFDQETESLFSDAAAATAPDRTGSPVAFPARPDKFETEQPQEEKKSPVKPDVFMELDPLGTGWVKPYVDKKDFFQDLKNPPKKVLKELLTETSATTTTTVEEGRSPQNAAGTGTPSKEVAPGRTTANVLPPFGAGRDQLDGSGRYEKADPFEDSDPFEKTDPFGDKSFSQSIELPSLFGNKSLEVVFPEMNSFERREEEEEEEEEEEAAAAVEKGRQEARGGLFSAGSLRGPLRVSLPPEKSEAGASFSLSSITSKLGGSPSPPEDAKTLRRRNYQVLKQATEEMQRSPVRDEFFCTSRSPKTSSAYSPKSHSRSFREKPCFGGAASERAEKASRPSEDAFPETGPKPKAALFSIKPPPLPPKKQNQASAKPPARPPSLEEGGLHYDYLRSQEAAAPRGQEPQNSKSEARPGPEGAGFPLLPPPPQRKTSADKVQSEGRAKETGKSVLNLTLNQLDNTGLENLAVTLGIPSDHIYNMTLQELTKRLSVKYLNPEAGGAAVFPATAAPRGTEATFHADFESNFGKSEPARSGNAPAYDKYAVFKELIENDNNRNSGRLVAIGKEEQEAAEHPEEDRYAALRQLSMTAQKSEIPAEEIESGMEDGGNRGDVPEEVGAKAEEAASAKVQAESSEAATTVETVKDWAEEAPAEREKKREEGAPGTAEKAKPEPGRSLFEEKEEEDEEEEEEEDDDEGEEEDEEEEERENWATFEKASLFVAGETFAENENDNSPFSSDDKEDSFGWRREKAGRGGRGEGDAPWRDEDESWDDYSPKESYWSDESSHDDRFAEKRRDGRYQRRAWSKPTRRSKAASEQWCRRAKWNEDTEDEYEESWKNRRYRTGGCDADRKGEICPVNSHDGWCNSQWEENGRYLRCCAERRKKSESEDEYRRRCDSDTSDREYVWTFRRNFPETHGRSDKQKQRQKQYQVLAPLERCHEPRSKHRKGESHKRPSSASDGKRSYEKISSAGEHGGKGKRATPEEDRSPPYHKDFRYCCAAEAGHNYNSYERRLHTLQAKKPGRSRRTEAPEPGHRHPDGTEKKPDAFEYYKSMWQKPPEESRRGRQHQFEDDFAPVAAVAPGPSQAKTQTLTQSPRRRRRDEWTSSPKEAFPRESEPFEGFAEDSRPPRDPDSERAQTPKQQKQVFGKNHFAVLTRQESSASLRKSESINIFSRENDPFEDDEFFSATPAAGSKLAKFSSEKSKSNSNVSDAITWKQVFGESSYRE